MERDNSSELRDRWVEIATLLLILGLAAYLRFANLPENPGWYSDEGTILNIVKNLNRGEVQYLAIRDSTLLAARLPLFPLIVSMGTRIFGETILALRAISSSLGVFSVGLLYLFVRRTQENHDPALPLISAFLLAIYPQAVLYSRVGFSYNLLSPLGLLVGIGLWGYLGTTNKSPGKGSGFSYWEAKGWLGFTAVTIGVGMLSELVAVLFLIPLMIIVVYRHWWDLIWSLPLAFIPFMLFVLLSLMASGFPLLFDLGYMFTSLGENYSFLLQFPAVLMNYVGLLFWDLWWILALVGWFFLKPERLLRFVLVFTLPPLLAILRTANIAGMGYYYAIPFFPFVALGVGGLIRFGAPGVYSVLRRAIFDYGSGLFGDRIRERGLGWGAAVGTGLIVFLPILFYLFLAASQVQFGFRTPMDSLLINPEDASRVAAFINDHTNGTDLVVSSPATAWLFDSRVSDFQLSLAAEGIPTKHFPGNIPPSRLAYKVAFREASYVIVDNASRNWTGPNIPEVAQVLMEVERWPQAFEAGEIAVYRNPNVGSTE